MTSIANVASGVYTEDEEMRTSFNLVRWPWALARARRSSGSFHVGEDGGEIHRRPRLVVGGNYMEDQEERVRLVFA